MFEIIAGDQNNSPHLFCSPEYSDRRYWRITKVCRYNFETSRRQDFTKSWSPSRMQFSAFLRFVFAQSYYFSSWASKSNLDCAQESEHAPDFSPRVLYIEKDGRKARMKYSLIKFLTKLSGE